LKFPILSGQNGKTTATPANGNAPSTPLLASQSFLGLCKLGLAFTWPLAVVALLGLGVLVALLVRSL
jgi:hypothetical protein